MARQIEDRTKEDKDCMILFEKWLAYDELKEMITSCSDQEMTMKIQ